MKEHTRNQKRPRMSTSNLHDDRLSDLPDCLILLILSLINDTKTAVRTCVLSKRWRFFPHTFHLNKPNVWPDTLISHILCLLKDTKFAVQTCVLSKRWRNSWTHLPSLYLDDSSFKDDKQVSFRKFVLNIMFKRKPYKIQTLSFYNSSNRAKSNYKTEENFLNKVIAYTSSLGVEELDTNNDFLLKGCCASLPDLKSVKVMSRYLCYMEILSGDRSVFASLTRLHIEDITLCVEDGLVDLFSSCVNLEELVLLKCRFGNAPKVITLSSSSSLVRLTLSELLFQYKEITIKASRLLELNVRGIRYPLSVDGCPILQKVDITGPDKDYRYVKGAPVILFHSSLQTFYQEIVKNIIPKTKSLVLRYLNWKWIFKRYNDCASVEIYAPTFNQSVVIVT